MMIQSISLINCDTCVCVCAPKMTEKQEIFIIYYILSPGQLKKNLKSENIIKMFFIKWWCERKRRTVNRKKACAERETYTQLAVI